MREIVLDTETTGFDPYEGHRVVEIGCVELVNLLPTGLHFQAYLNPERPMPLEAFQVHGLSDGFLADKPLFAAIAQDFLGFIGEDARLIAHNADFDMRFINWELQNAGLPALPMSRVRDTVSMARRALPGMRVTLDNLCRRFNIDLSARQKHGALLDAELLAEVYLELSGGRQNRLALASAAASTPLPGGPAAAAAASRKPRPRRHFAPSAEEKAAHQAFIDTMSDPLWRR
ncbi:MAG: DNA polymerase III subunit epsilon [Sphingomonadales bacterium]